MNAKITYRMDYRLHPWSEDKRMQGVKIWCLLEVVTPSHGVNETSNPIAVFNLDSEAERFQCAMSCGGVVEASPSMSEIINSIGMKK